MLDRFSALLLLRRLVRNPGHRRCATISETIMVELARRRRQPEEDWAGLGLLAFLDYEYAQQNVHALGEISAQQAAIEGVPAEHADALRTFRSAQHHASELEDALAIATSLAEATLHPDNAPFDGPFCVAQLRRCNDRFAAAADRLALDDAALTTLLARTVVEVNGG